MPLFLYPKLSMQFKKAYHQDKLFITKHHGLHIPHGS